MASHHPHALVIDLPNDYKVYQCGEQPGRQRRIMRETWSDGALQTASSVGARSTAMVRCTRLASALLNALPGPAMNACKFKDWDSQCIPPTRHVCSANKALDNVLVTH